MNNEKWEDKIEHYLEGELSGEALKDFEANLKKDKSLQERLALSKGVEKAFKNERLKKHFIPHLETLGKQYILSKNETSTEPVSDSSEKDDTATSINRRNLFLLLIVIIGMVGLYTAFKLINKTTEKTQDQIFATHFNPLSPNEINRGDSTTSDYEKAIKAYEAQNYTAALTIFEAKYASSPNDMSNTLLLSNVYLSLQQSEKAIELLQPLVSDNTHLFTKEAQWYLALAYVQLNQQELAVPLLEKLSAQERGKYVQSAVDLLENLRYPK